jgi:hypothetical protein
METIYSSETLVDFEGTTRRYIPEANTLHILKRSITPFKGVIRKQSMAILAQEFYEG